MRKMSYRLLCTATAATNDYVELGTSSEALGEIGFMEPAMADHMMAAMSRIFSRGALTVDDVRILMGVVRQSRWAVSRGPRRDR